MLFIYLLFFLLKLTLQQGKWNYEHRNGTHYQNSTNRIQYQAKSDDPGEEGQFLYQNDKDQIEYEERRDKRFNVTDIERNYTHMDLEKVMELKQEVNKQDENAQFKQKIHQEDDKKKKAKAIVVTLDENLKQKRIGKFEFEGSGAKIIYPDSKQNEDQRFQRVQELLLNNRNIYSAQTQQVPQETLSKLGNSDDITTQDLQDGADQNGIKMALNEEEDKYQNSLNDFMSYKQRKAENQFISQTKQMIFKKQVFPKSDLGSQIAPAYNMIFPKINYVKGPQEPPTGGI